ncbi:uncharacterized protein LOC34617499 [Cyclospora cayetanensis]|uniref:Uncharacterized protein LOC34617499 n=1 Tax=Cyclospora cayetanensis TaxID=88456 RepID=A0A6P6RUJ1_9EIME|nr:uncharacterized protein LOC34617499 [Cyclospora cayetanensis]
MMCGPKGFAWLPLWFAFIAAGPWYGLQRDFLSVEGLPLQDDEEPFPWEWGGTRSAMCEACQAVAELLSCSSRTTSGGISSPCYNTLPYLSKGTKRDPALLILENEKDNDPIKWLQRRQLLICDGGLVDYYAQQTETIHEATLAAACGDIFKERGDQILHLFYHQEHPRAIGTGDSVAIAASNKGEAAAALCLPSPCASLWGEGDAPALRPSRSSRSLRDSLLFLSLNQQTPGTETLPSGLQLRWLHRRPEAQPEQTVKGCGPRLFAVAGLPIVAAALDTAREAFASKFGGILFPCRPIRGRLAASTANNTAALKAATPSIVKTFAIRNVIDDAGSFLAFPTLCTALGLARGSRPYEAPRSGATVSLSAARLWGKRI